MKSMIYFALAVTLVFTSAAPEFGLPEEASTTFSCDDVTEIPHLECEALVSLYNNTNGPGWTNNTNWLQSLYPHDWYGVWVGGGSVIYLYIDDNFLTGSLPPEIGNLTHLEQLTLNDNQLSGSIPMELWNLPGLSYLLIRNNKLSGTIPSEIGNLTNLVNFDLSSNQLTGSIPVELASLPIVFLSLNDNQLSGDISSELGNLTSLKKLDLSGNHLSGCIPPELGNLTELDILHLQENWLRGDVPETFVNLVNLWNPGQYWTDGLDLDYNRLNVPEDYPNLADPLQFFLYQKDPDWHLRQIIVQNFFLPVIHH